jgi:hypothetical protein
VSGPGDGWALCVCGDTGAGRATKVRFREHSICRSDNDIGSLEALPILVFAAAFLSNTCISSADPPLVPPRPTMRTTLLSLLAAGPVAAAGGPFTYSLVSDPLSPPSTTTITLLTTVLLTSTGSFRFSKKTAHIFTYFSLSSSPAAHNRPLSVLYDHDHISVSIPAGNDHDNDSLKPVPVTITID